ncbi:hypothetical protein XENOCAPTIV_015971, partial [Xenoophorus captivus]
APLVLLVFLVGLGPEEKRGPPGPQVAMLEVVYTLPVLSLPALSHLNFLMSSRVHLALLVYRVLQVEMVDHLDHLGLLDHQDRLYTSHQEMLHHASQGTYMCSPSPGQKGEPGIIMGPDGRPLYLGGLTGQPVLCLYNHQCQTSCSLGFFMSIKCHELIY